MKSPIKKSLSRLKGASSLSRRSAMGTGVSAALALHWQKPARAESYPPLVATVVLSGKTYVYREDQGRDLGDFDSAIGKFTQGCIKTEVQGSPLTVYFRPDRSSARSEVVFELGRLFSGTPENLAAYQVTIARGDQTLASLNVPAHYWFSRWRWQSAPRPIVANIDELIFQGFLPPYDRSGIPGTTPIRETPAQAAAHDDAVTTASTGSPALIVGQPLTNQVVNLTQVQYSISAQAGATYAVRLTQGGPGSVLMAIQDGDGNWLAMNFDGAGFTEQVSFTPAVSGTFKVTIQSLTGGSVAYALVLDGPAPAGEPQPVTPTNPVITPPETAPPPPVVQPIADDFPGDASSPGTLAVAGSVSGVIGVRGDRDDFKLTLNSTTTYRIICASTSLSQPLLTVRDGAGQIVARSDTEITVPVSLSFKPATNGTYWLAIEDVAGGTGNYTITLANTTLAMPVYSLMGLAGVTPYMPSTGERADIGLVTGPQADFLCTESASALGLVRAQAEAAGTMPWHMRDENTNAPINFNTYVNATWYEINRGWSPYVRTTQTPVTLDSAHQPALAYLPYVLTGDPYHLEDLQFQANWNWGTFPPGFRPSVGQSRSLAWTLRTLAQSAKVSPKAVPSWLLPQSYWNQMLESYGQYLEQNYVNNPSIPTSRFRSTSDIDNNRSELPSGPPGGTWIDPWQEEFLLSVLGWMLAMGFTQWRTIFDWKAVSTIVRTSTTSGWNRAYATPYRVMIRRDRDAPYVSSWGEALALNQQVLNYGPAMDDTWANADMTYLQYTLGSLVYISMRGNVDVSDNLKWAIKQFEIKPSWKVPNKWRLTANIRVPERSGGF